MNDSPVRTEMDTGRRLARIVLARPKANIVNAEMIAALQSVFDEYRTRQDLGAVLLTADGPNFSYGASVEEHLPGQCEQMLRELHALIITMLDYPVPVLVAIRGFCLGGGMELAIAGNFLFASPDAVFGQPEIQLAVFAPAASCLLPERIGITRAEELLWSGRNADANEALHMGLVMDISEDPVEAAMAWYERYIAPHSSCAMRHAVWAAKQDYVSRMKDRIARVEARYLQDLMSSHDAVEGLNAFIGKRRAAWKHK